MHKQISQVKPIYLFSFVYHRYQNNAIKNRTSEKKNPREGLSNVALKPPIYSLFNLSLVHVNQGLELFKYFMFALNVWLLHYIHKLTMFLRALFVDHYIWSALLPFLEGISFYLPRKDEWNNTWFKWTLNTLNSVHAFTMVILCL